LFTLAVDSDGHNCSVGPSQSQTLLLYHTAERILFFRSLKSVCEF